MKSEFSNKIYPGLTYQLDIDVTLKYFPDICFD